MRKLDLPDVEYQDLVSKCAEGIIQDTAMKARLTSSQGALYAHGLNYKDKASQGEWHDFEKNAPGNPIVAGTLTADDLRKLYTNFLAKRGKPARAIYDRIRNSAKGVCPFCGIGTPRTLDHFLPKVGFAEFSLLPWNLIPACRDCNHEMGSSYVSEGGAQLINPYFDKSLFFQEQWVSAEVFEDGDNDIKVQFFADPPADWSGQDKLRAIRHFERFGLAYIYEIRASEHIASLLRQIKVQLEAGVSTNEISSDLISPIAEGQLPNTWLRTLCIAMGRQLNLIAGCLGFEMAEI